MKANKEARSLFYFDSSKQRNVDFRAFGADADDHIADCGHGALCLQTSHVDGDEANWKVAPCLRGFHLPQEVDVAVYVADVDCELEKSGVAVRVVDWHRDAVD